MQRILKKLKCRPKPYYSYGGDLFIKPPHPYTPPAEGNFETKFFAVLYRGFYAK
ncbi:MAG: hypothetical protein LBP62_01460 [Clostridiales bacterium]|nr:hypothetical protein [Clostridiales bacterium]